MNECRLVYTSISGDKLLDRGALAAMVEKAQAKNESRGISGMLLLSGDRFVQVLEGKPSEVNALYRRIVTDPRHGEVDLIGFEQIGVRLFSNWGMIVVDLSDLPMEERKPLEDKYDSGDGFFLIPDDIDSALELLLEVRELKLGKA